MKGLPGFEYETAVTKVASHLQPKKQQVDCIGNLYDDYVSDLCLEALQASHSFRQRYEGNTRQERRYVYKSLWNFARERNRSRARQNKFDHYEYRSDEDGVGIEGQLEARDSLRRIRSQVDLKDWKSLELVILEGGNLSDAWCREGNRGYTHFTARISETRKKMKRILNYS